MKLITPFDYWRAGWGFWLATLQSQIDLNDRMLALFKAQPGGTDPDPVTVPVRAPAARRRSARPAA